jgi:hypothetical protein
MLHRHKLGKSKVKTNLKYLQTCWEMQSDRDGTRSVEGSVRERSRNGERAPKGRNAGFVCACTGIPAERSEVKRIRRKCIVKSKETMADVMCDAVSECGSDVLVWACCSDSVSCADARVGRVKHCRNATPVS